MEKLKVLVVDDDDLVHETFKLCLPDHWQMVSCQSTKLPENHFFHGAFVDMHLTGQLNQAEGLDVIGQLSEAHPQLEIVAFSGDLNRELMEKSLQKGATRFLAKPLSTAEIQLILGKIEALWQLRGVHGQPEPSATWVGHSELSEKLRRTVAQMSGEKMPILIEGESGTGKEVVAGMLRHQGGGRPFVSVNVAAIPGELFESTFFGHVKGAFSGAVNNRLGLAEQAHGGDLFLDEIEALAEEHQAKLLRFLETGEYRRVGGDQVRKAQVRIIAATNRNLKKMVQEKSFREDLLFRLSGQHILLPPLRQRTSDLEDLCTHFANPRNTVLKKSFSPEALAELAKHSWPGNVRELKRVVEQLCANAPLPVIRVEDVRKLLSVEGLSSSPTTLDLSLGLATLTSQFEKQVLSQILKQTSDVEEMIKILQISRSSLYKKVKDHELELSKGGGAS